MNATRQHRGSSRSVLAILLLVGVLLGIVVGPSGASADSIDDKRRQAAAIADQLENLVDQMNALGENYSEALQTQADLSVEIERAQADVAAAEAQLAQMRGTLYMSAVTQFMHGGRNSTLTNLFASSGGVQDALQRSQLTSIAMNQGSLTTDSLDATATECPHASAPQQLPGHPRRVAVHSRAPRTGRPCNAWQLDLPRLQLLCPASRAGRHAPVCLPAHQQRDPQHPRRRPLRRRNSL